MQDQTAFNSETRTILVVDDSSTVRKCVSRFLAGVPVRLQFAEDGYEAIKQVQSGQHIDLIMADVMMPRVSGYELCAMVKGQARTSNIPFYVVSSKEGPVDRAFAESCGADGFLSKPFDSTNLRSAIETIFNLEPLKEAA